MTSHCQEVLSMRSEVSTIRVSGSVKGRQCRQEAALEAIRLRRVLTGLAAALDTS